MCESKEAGGVRCAAHTRPGWESVLSAHADFLGPENSFKPIQHTWLNTPEGAAAFEHIKEHASTPQGAKEIAEWRSAFTAANSHNRINAFQAFIQRGYLAGVEVGEQRKAIRADVKKAQKQANAQEHGWREGPGEGYEWMHPTKNLQPGNSCLDKFPGIGQYWSAEDNPHMQPRFKGDKEPERGAGVGPEQVTTGSNSELFWRCPQGHLNRGRVNLFTNSLRDYGRTPECKTCQPRRQAAFESTKADLGSIVAAMGEDPAAFDSLSPALRYSLLSKMGMLGSGRGNVQRDLAMNLIHSDLTLAEVVKADEFSKLERKMRDLDADDEDDLGTITDITQGPTQSKERSSLANVRRAMDAAGVAALVDGDQELAEHIMRENVNALWHEAYKPQANIERLVATVNANRDRTSHSAELADRFVSELERVRNAPLPDGYQQTVTANGVELTREPNLVQRRFMTMVEERRRVTNWSGTGAGKTLAAALAIQNSGAQETLIVCPNGSVAEQWQAEFENTFPGKTEVRQGLPTGQEPAAAPGVNRVWVANYEKFQGDPEETERRLTGLAGRVDAIVYDEIHMAKQREETTASKRRTALERFTDTAGQANPDLVVVGTSATPVINNLEEAASVLRLVGGPQTPRFPTQPTIRNAAVAHHHLAAAGIRTLPTYATKMKREDVVVDITDQVHRVQASVNAAARQAGTRSVTQAMMEQALLPSKLPTILEKVKGRGPSLVYTHFTTGMVEPMRKYLSDAGLRVGTYTGDESLQERAQTKQAFIDGNLDVLIGSRPISVGVDGLQNVSSNLVVASMPETAADDDQLVGRLFRQGQSRDVTVSYVMTEAKVGELRWSWCAHRKQRILFKRGLADAATDGVMPEGVLESDTAATRAEVEALAKFAGAKSRASVGAA